MKIYLLHDVEHVGLSGQMVKVSDGYATNYLLPRGLAKKVEPKEESFLAKHARKASVRAEELNTKAGILAENLRNTHITIKKKVHDDNRLYGSVTSDEIVDALRQKGLVINKKQVLLEKGLKELGEHQVTIKVSATIKADVSVKVSAEK